MLKEIKAYWYELKTEYENRYGEEILRDYDRSKEFLEKMQVYLESKLAENPSNVDIVCTLASVKLELRHGDEAYIELLENFLDEFGDDLDESSKARIYTNIAFVEDYSQKALEYLNKAKERKSMKQNNKLRCKVKFFNGVRVELPNLNSGKYRPHLMVKGDTRYLGVCFIDGQEANFDTWVKCLVSPLYEDIDYSGLTCGTEFYVMEGPNKVGEGVVDQI